MRALPVQISSPENSKVKELRSLYRRQVRYRERLFLVEGVRLLQEALAAGYPPRLVLYVPERLAETPRGQALLEQLAASGTAMTTTPAILDSVADTVTPQGVVAAVPMPELPPRPEGLLLILDTIRDPGNCGTILRTAEAAGVSIVYCAPGTVDPFSPKVVRGGMGAHFRLPMRVADWDEIGSAVARRQLLLADARGQETYDHVDWRQPTALIVGGEAEGASPQALELNPTLVSIPMAGGAESLNAAVAAGVLLFEALRAR